MMEMVEMKLPKKSKKELKGECCPVSPGEQDQWPYGLQIRFEKDQVDKLSSLTMYKVGDKVMIQAEACVTSIRMSEQQNKDISHSVEMQIEKISCSPKVMKKPEEMSPKEYRSMRMGK